MLSTPPTKKSEPRPAAILSYAEVKASNPEAQLRCTVTAGTVSGTPARRAMTRATLAASAGCPTQPKMTSSIKAGSSPVRVSSASTAMRPNSSAAKAARSVPALQNGVRTPSTMTSRSGMFGVRSGFVRERRRDSAVLGFVLSIPGCRRARPVIDDALFLELRADALAPAKFIDGVEFDAVRMHFEVGLESARRASRATGSPENHPSFRRGG